MTATLRLLTPDSPMTVLDEVVVVAGAFIAPEEVVMASGGMFMLVDEFECKDRSCAPPPVGTGGSRSTGGAQVRPAVAEKTKKGVKTLESVDMSKEAAGEKFWNGKMVEAAKAGRLVPDTVTTGDEVVEVFHGNISKLYRVIDAAVAADPLIKEIVAAAAQWYPAAHDLAGDRAAQHGIHRDTATAVLARLSPGHDWDSNIGEMDIVLNVRTKNAQVSSQVMEPILRQIYEKRLANAKTPAQKVNAEKALVALSDLLKRVDGKRFNDLSASDRATILQAHAIVTGEDFTMKKWVVRDGKCVSDGPRFNTDGSMKAINFQSNGTWEKVFRMLDADGEPDDVRMAVIDRGLGSGAKVRSFFNNISDPYSPRHDITMDTHATSVIAGRRVAQESPEYDNISGGKSEGAFSGGYVAGTEAYRRIAQERGMDRPNAAQSETWVARKGINDYRKASGAPQTEAIRELLSDEKRRSKLSADAVRYFEKELAERDAWGRVDALAKQMGVEL